MPPFSDLHVLWSPSYNSEPVVRSSATSLTLLRGALLCAYIARSSGVGLIQCLFIRIIVRGFVLGTYDLSSQRLGDSKNCSRFEFHLVEQVLNPFWKWLAILQYPFHSCTCGPYSNMNSAGAVTLYTSPAQAQARLWMWNGELAPCLPVSIFELICSVLLQVPSCYVSGSGKAPSID